MAERRPLVIGADGCPEELPIGDTLPASLGFFDFARSENGLINQTTTLEDFLTLTTNLPEDGTYEIGWHYEWSFNDAGQDFIAEVDIDGTVISNHRQEPKDVGGTGVVLPVIGGGTANTGTNQRHIESGVDIQAGLTAGSTTIRIRFAGSQANDEAAIYRARIYIRRVA